MPVVAAPRVSSGCERSYDTWIRDNRGELVSLLASGSSNALTTTGALVTAAVLADATDADGISTDAVGHLDFINLMAYDGPKSNHSSYAMAERSVATWLARGIHPDKLVLGVPFYARPGGATYRTLLANDPATASGDRILFKGVEQNYNGPATIRRKTELALQLAGGIMIWELSQDARGSDSLLRVIGETVAAP